MSVQFSHSVVSDSLPLHELQHTRPPCPSPTPRVYPNSCPWVCDATQPSHLPLSPSSPVLNLSQHQGSSNESTLCNISPSNEHPGLIFFRMDWLDLLVVQGTLKSLFQHHSSKASILQRSLLWESQILNISKMLPTSNERKYKNLSHFSSLPVRWCQYYINFLVDKTITQNIRFLYFENKVTNGLKE